MFQTVKAAALALLLPVQAALAEPAPPWTAPGIELADFGIYCALQSAGTQAAPDTTLGYIHTLTGVPAIVFHQQEVPARLGVHFGVIVRTDRDIPGVRNETWLPGASRPEVWVSDLIAGQDHARGFQFDFDRELLPGRWTMEAYDGDTLLYRVEWDVVPPETLPGVGSDCDFLS